jgi:hypothetical protein
MSRYGYAYEKLLGAVEIMATGKGPRPERLARATHQCMLKLRRPEEHRLPRELGDRLSEIIAGMTAVPPPTQWDNAIDATARQMPWQQAERLSRKLFELFLSVAALREARA